jgi:hypothetical protein
MPASKFIHGNGMKWKSCDDPSGMWRPADSTPNSFKNFIAKQNLLKNSYSYFNSVLNCYTSSLFDNLSNCDNNTNAQPAVTVTFCSRLLVLMLKQDVTAFLDPVVNQQGKKNRKYVLSHPRETPYGTQPKYL